MHVRLQEIDHTLSQSLHSCQQTLFYNRQLMDLDTVFASIFMRKSTRCFVTLRLWRPHPALYNDGAIIIIGTETVYENIARSLPMQVSMEDMPNETVIATYLVLHLHVHTPSLTCQ